eukprot:g81658.t1
MPLDNLPARLFLVGCSNAVGGVYTNWFSRIFRDIQDLNPGFLIPKILDYQPKQAYAAEGECWGGTDLCSQQVLYFCFCQLSHGALIYSSVLRKMVDTEKFEQEAVASQLPPLAQNENDIGAYSKLMATFVDVFKGYSDYDGLMCLEEFLTLSRSYFPEADKKVQEAKARKRFESFDLNGDQQLDFTEFAQLKTGMHLHLSFNQGLLDGPKLGKVDGLGDVPCTGGNAQDLREQNRLLFQEKVNALKPRLTTITDFTGWKLIVPEEKFERFRESFGGETEDPELAKLPAAPFALGLHTKYREMMVNVNFDLKLVEHNRDSKELDDVEPL